MADVLPAIDRILVDAARRDRRYMLGIVGLPGAGKSHISAWMQGQVGVAHCAVIPQDGFHFAAHVIAGTEAEGRRGAPDTFDSWGFASLLTRLRARVEDVVYAPQFDRRIEDPTGAAITVRRDQRLVIVEGNYLLADGQGWGAVRELLDEVWLVARPEDVRMRDLAQRHMSAGKSFDDAWAWARGSDAINADYIERFADRADRLIIIEREQDS